MTRKRRFGTDDKTTEEVEQLERDVKRKQLKKKLKELEEQEKKEEKAALFERAKKVEKYFKKGNIPEDVNKEQVIKAEKKAKEEKEKAKKEEEDHKEIVEGEQGQEAAKKIQIFFRNSKKLQLEKQQDFLTELGENFPDSKESSISFPSIDKVNNKLADLFDYVEKNTIEESEETEDLEKQQIEAEIELTKAETKQAISESERINNFGTENDKVQQGIKKKVTASMGVSESGFKNKLFDDSDKERFFNLIDKIGEETLSNDQINLLVQYINIIQVLFRHKGSTENWEKSEWSDDEKIFFDKASSIASENISIRSALENLDTIDSYHFKDIHNLKTQNKNEQENIKQKKKIILDNKNAINPLMSQLTATEDVITKLHAESRSINELIKVKLPSSDDGGKLSLQRNIEEVIETNFNKEIEYLKLGGTTIGEKYNKLVEYLNKCTTQGTMSVYKQITNNKEIDDIYIKVNNLLNIDSKTENEFKKKYNQMTSGIKSAIDQQFIQNQIPDYDNDKTLTENVKSCNESIQNNINQELKKAGNKKRKLQKTIEGHNNDITAAKYEIRTSKQKIERNQKNIDETIKEIEKVKNVIKQDVQNFEQSLSKAMKFGIMLKDFGIENKQVFLEKNEDFFKKQLIEKYEKFKLPFETNSDKDYIKRYKSFIKQCVDKGFDDDERKQAFISLSDELNKFIILNFPVKSIINLSTFLKPPDEKSKRDIFKVNIDSTKEYVWAEYIELLNKIDTIDDNDKAKENKINTTDDNEETKESIQSSISKILKKNPKFKDKTDDWAEFLKLEKQITNVYNDKLENDISKILKENPDFRFIEESSILNVEFLTLEDTKNNKKGKIINILGEPLPYLQNWMYDGTKGPFYKIFHTSNDNSEKRQYEVKEDLKRLLTEDKESSSCDHITFAGYGFSGSGKTFTLIEGTTQFGYTSVINQIKNFLNFNNNEINEIKINIYEKYIENVDNFCTPNVNWKSFSKINELKGYIKDPININGLDTQLHNINEKRKIKVVPDNTGTLSKDVFRTSIRKTTYNPESSRAHLFVDIEFNNKHGKNKKITVMDMAGAEKVDVIQNDYFISENKKTFNSDIFNNAFEIIEQGFDNIPEQNAYSYISNGNFNSDFKSRNTKNRQKLSFDKVLNDLSTTNLINQKGGTDNYIIPDRWEQLFFATEKKDGLKDLLPENLLGKKDKWETEHKNFISNYNNNQYTTKIKILIDFIDSLKKLEDLDSYREGKNVLTFITQKVPQIKNLKHLQEVTFYDTANRLRRNLVKLIRKYLYNKTDETLQGRAKEIELDLKKKKKEMTLEKFVHTAERKKYLPIINFAKIEYNIYHWKSGKGQDSSKYQAICGIIGAGSIAKKWGDVLNKLQVVLRSIEKILEKDLENKNKIQSKIRALGNTNYTINTNFKPKQTFEDIKQEIENAHTQNLTWNKTMITKYHCPLRFQGLGIMQSINEFKTNLQGLNNQKDNFKPNTDTFPYNVDEWVGENLKKKNFVIFTNIRLDFNKRLCEYKDSDIVIPDREIPENISAKEKIIIRAENNRRRQELAENNENNENNKKKKTYEYPKYAPICEAYDTAINFSHELLYSENSENSENTDYNKAALNNIFNEEVGEKEAINNSERKLTKKERQQQNKKIRDGNKLFHATGTNEIRGGSNKFGKKKVSKKTSTRSFRKRGRRRAPSGTEIL